MGILLTWTKFTSKFTNGERRVKNGFPENLRRGFGMVVRFLFLIAEEN